jgi:hypothetical protein
MACSICVFQRSLAIRHSTRYCLILILLAIVSASGVSQTLPPSLNYRTSKGLTIRVIGGGISINGKNLYKLHEDVVIY